MTVPRQKLPRGDIFNETGGLPVKNEPRPASTRGRGSGLKPRDAQGSIGYETRAELFYAGAVTDVEPRQSLAGGARSRRRHGTYRVAAQGADAILTPWLDASLGVATTAIEAIARERVAPPGLIAGEQPDQRRVGPGSS